MSDAAEQDCPGHAKVCKADCTSVPHPQCHHLASRMEVICWFWCLWHIQAYWGRLWHPLSGLIHPLSLSDVTAVPSEGAQLAETNLREYKPQQIAAGYRGGRRGCWLCWVSSINSIPSDTGGRGWTIEVFPFVTPALQGHESQHQWAVSYAKGYKGGSKGLTIAWLLRGKLRQSWCPHFAGVPYLQGIWEIQTQNSPPSLRATRDTTALILPQILLFPTWSPSTTPSSWTSSMTARKASLLGSREH